MLDSDILSVLLRHAAIQILHFLRYVNDGYFGTGTCQ